MTYNCSLIIQFHRIQQSQSDTSYLQKNSAFFPEIPIKIQAIIQQMFGRACNPISFGKTSIPTTHIPLETQAVTQQVSNPTSNEFSSLEPSHSLVGNDPLSAVSSILKEASQNQNAIYTKSSKVCSKKPNQATVYWMSPPLVSTNLMPQVDAAVSQPSESTKSLFELLSDYKFPEEAPCKKLDTNNESVVNSMLQNFWLQIYIENPHLKKHHYTTLAILRQYREAAQQQQISDH